MACVLWVHPSDCDPPHGLDMEAEHDRKKVKDLFDAFAAEGFNKKYPALVGYPNGEGRIQLLSGTHRHFAAVMAGILLPVTLWLRSDVEESWGMEEWARVMRDVPVEELENWTREDVEKHRRLFTTQHNILQPPANPFTRRE